MDRKEAVKRAEELVSKMTVSEAASQLRYDAASIKRLGVPEYNWWNEALHGVARAGTATVFPQAIALAAAFDEELMKEVGKAIALEARAKYNESVRQRDRDIYKGLTFWAPNVNIFRDPRWGRGHETYGEDPYLTGRLAVNFIKGIQKKNEEGYMMAAACAKHFAVHSGPEALRHEFDAKVSSKDLYETYLPAFKMCVEEGEAEAVMGAYNRVNGEPCCANKRLIQDVLRKDWGFKGHFLSDCWAVRDFHEHHHVTDTPEQSVKLALEAGCDLNCGCTYQKVMNAFEQGLISEETIRMAAVRLMTTRYMLGMFDDTTFDDIPYEIVECKRHRDLNDRAAEECLVLLKNNGVLPIKKDRVKTIGVIGPNADSRRALMGNYYGTSSRYITVLEGIEDEAEKVGIRVLYSKGCHLFKEQPDGLARPYNEMAQAMAVVKHSDLVIICLGLDETLEGEEGDESNANASGDKMDLNLPTPQRKLLESAVVFGKPMVIINMSGSAVDLSFADERADAVVQAWYCGARGGRAVARMLFGKEVPSGKLPVTFYRDMCGMPDFADYSMKKRTYRYLENRPLYPFGYGLGYAGADIIVADLEKISYFVAACSGANLTVCVANHSVWMVKDVIQIYVKVEGSVNEVRNHKLAAFKRVNLEPLVKQTVTLWIPPEAFMTVNEDGIYEADGSGAYVYVGFGQPDERTEELTGKKCKKIYISG